MNNKKSLLNKELPSIAALAKGESSWRIDWFGDLAFPNRLLRRTQPSLLVHLSKVLDDRFHSDPSVLLSPDSTTPARFQRKVWISAGTLPLLRVGDIWRDGKLEARPDYQLERFADLLIDESTVQLIKAGLNLDDQGFLLPLSEHPWHLNCTHSYCVMVGLQDGRRMIIPCIELIRFYFGSSSELIKRLFLPPLQRQDLYLDSRFNPLTQRLVIDLAEKISGTSAADIGRMHLDPVAWRAALHIGTSALRASVSGRTVYPQGFFPFEGETSLIASGKWLSLGDRANSTFLVYQLRSCSHPFPFRSLRYKIHAAKSSTKSNATQPSCDEIRSSSNGREPQQTMVERDASNSLATKAIQVRAEPRFPDLENKPIWKSKALATESNPTYVARPCEHPVAHVAVGDPGSEQRIRSVSLDIMLRANPERRETIPPFLLEAVEVFNTIDDLNIDLLTESDEDGWTVPITALSDEDGEIDMGLFVERNNGVVRLRRVAAFGVRRQQVQICVVLVESSPPYIKLYPTSGKTDDEVWSTLFSVGKDYLSFPSAGIVSISDCVSILRDLLG